ncbi:MAG TPA: OST-HTH/LOTUS domain-containing protein, partial [Chitinophagaceae bacterium]|nr:OST-HTH/LOTUS domain-containing protein [Chitinophagaceae bacterium]
MAIDNRQLLVKAASSIEDFDEWFPIEELGVNLKKIGFDVRSTGHSRLLDYILEQPDLFKVKVNLENKRSPTYLVTFIGKPIIPEDLDESTEMTIDSSRNGKGNFIKVNSEEILESIARNWKLDAKLESTQNYFYHLQEVSSIINKSKYYIIGRKGSGKSSIGEYLLSLRSHDTFTEKLSFKNFPFNEL